MALDTLVALKVLLKSEEPGAQERFLSEARLASKVRHPNTVYISDVGELEDGRAFLEMEFLDGRTLAADLVRGPIELLRACQIVMQIARGLQAVHDKGIIHRDMKPDNVFLVEQDGAQDFVKIVDFGIAKVARQGDTPGDGTSPITAAEAGLDAKGDSDSGAIPMPRSNSYTLPGKVMGTPGYMAPEQLQALRLDVRVDQYALGCIFYQMIAGRPVYQARGLQTLMMRHLMEKPLPLRKRCPKADIPASLDALVMRLLAREPDDRFASMREVELALQREIDLLLIARGDKIPVGSLTGQQVRSGIAGRWRRRDGVLWLLPVVVALGLMIVGYLGYRRFYQPRIKGSEIPGGILSRELAELRQRALIVLLSDAHSGILDLQGSAMLALGQTRDPDLRKELEDALTSAEPQIRAQAAVALGNLGNRLAISALAGLLEQSGPSRAGGHIENPQVKIAAAGALRQLGDPRGQRFLELTVDNKDADVQFRGALLFCDQGPRDVQRVLRAYSQRQGLPQSTLLNITACLARAGDTASLQRLHAQVSEVGPSELRLAAATKLAQLGDTEGLKYLRDAARKRDREQILAARELALLDESDGLDLFRQMVGNQEAQSLVRQLACDGLGGVGESIDVRRLVGLLGERDRYLRQAGARAIVQIAGRDPGLLSLQSMHWAQEAISDPDALVRESAAAILGDSLHAGAVTLLTRLLKDRDTRVRRSAAIALGKRKDEATVRALDGALLDTDREVRIESLRSLTQVGAALNSPGLARVSAKVRDSLLAMAKGQTGAATPERVIASGLLLRLGDVSQAQKLREWLGATDAELRRLALDQLPLTQDELAALLRDSAVEVRFLAARRLAALGDRRALPVLQDITAHGGSKAIIAYGLLRRLTPGLSTLNPVERLLLDPDPANRMEAVEAMAGLPLFEAEPYLIRASRDREPLVRRMVAEVAADLFDAQGGQVALIVVRRLATDPNTAVRVRAEVLLARLMQRKATALAAGSGEKPAAARAKLLDSETAAANLAGAVDGGASDAGDAGDAGAARDFAATGRVESAPSPAIDENFGDKGQPEPKSGRTASALPSEQLARDGLASFARADYKKAQRQLEKSIALCSRDRQHAAVCAASSCEVQLRLGQIYEKQKKWPEAMSAYQQVLALCAQVRGKAEIKVAAQAGVERLNSRLGQVVIPRKTKRGCQEDTIWLPPGVHSLKVDDKFEQIQVRARESVKVGTCR